MRILHLPSFDSWTDGSRLSATSPTNASGCWAGGEVMAGGGLRSAQRLAVDHRQEAGSARCERRLRQVKGGSRDPAIVFPMEHTQLLGCWLCPSAPGDRWSCTSSFWSISVRSIAHRLFFTGAVPGSGYALPTYPSCQGKAFFSPFAIFKTFAFFISSRLVSSLTSLEFNCAIPQFSKQINPDKTQTFEANCNLIQLKL